ncbi:MAG: hypothetical protein KKH91_02940 [Elusimicrobia bacterium]|nr:hypothetical protein [Elusimicrobiota bacterium]MBU2615102.1 hypothetical protein [Elusimicrobiota bacterium]
MLKIKALVLCVMSGFMVLFFTGISSAQKMSEEVSKEVLRMISRIEEVQSQQAALIAELKSYLNSPSPEEMEAKQKALEELKAKTAAKEDPKKKTVQKKEPDSKASDSNDSEW